MLREAFSFTGNAEMKLQIGPKLQTVTKNKHVTDAMAKLLNSKCNEAWCQSPVANKVEGFPKLEYALNQETPQKWYFF